MKKHTAAISIIILILLFSMVGIGGCGGGGTTSTGNAYTVKIVKTNGVEVDNTETPIPPGSTIKIAFTNAVSSEEERTAITDALALYAPDETTVDGEWAWNADYTQLIFTPASRLAFRTEYTLAVTAVADIPETPSSPTSPTSPTSPISPTTLSKSLSSGSFPFTTMTEGDINGDGFADLLVGAYNYDGAGSGRGAAYIFNGAAAELSTTYTTRLEGSADNDILGLSWDTADVNGDGYADVIVAAPDANTSTGAVYVYLGAASGIDTTPATTLDGIGGDDRFGCSVANAGDVNGDRFDDIIIGALDADDGATLSVGSATVYNGSATGISTTPDLTLKGSSAGERLGNFVSSAGDVNGDGYDDVCISAETVGTTGASYVHLGSATGLNATPATTLTGENPSDMFGLTCRSAGDLNGDGYDDMVIGAIGYDVGTNEEGAAYVYYGSSTGIPTTWSKRITGTQTLESLGFSAGAGDVDGDGYDDLVIGAYGYNADNGRSYLYLGSASGIGDTADKTIPSSVAQKFGLPLPGRDYNNDGFSDVTIGAPSYSGDTGAAYTYYGYASGLGDIPTTMMGENLNDVFSSYYEWP